MKLTPDHGQVLLWMDEFGGPPGRVQFSPRAATVKSRVYGLGAKRQVIGCVPGLVQMLVSGGFIEPDQTARRDTYVLTIKGGDWVDRKKKRNAKKRLD